MCLRGFPVLVLLTLLIGESAAAAPAPAPIDTAWTLDRCEAAALAHAPVLAAGRARAEAALAGADLAGAVRLPVVGFSGQTGYTTEFMTIETPTPTGVNTIAFGNGYNTDLMLGLRAPLFTGGRLQADAEAARAEWQASLADVAVDSLDLRRQVRQAFYAALGGEAAADAARQGEARLHRHLADVEDNLTVGMATEEARLQVLARLRRTEQGTIQAEAEAAARRYQLGGLVGRAGTQIRPRAELGASLLDGGEESRPWNDRAELRALDARLDAADQSARAASGSYWPTVDLEGGWHYGSPGVDPVTNEWMDYGTVALNLRWTLFDFGGRSSRVKSLRAQERALAASRDDLQDALHSRQANARTQLESVRRETERAGERLDLEQRRLVLAQERWQQGHATESEMLDAQDDVTLAASDHATALARLRLAEAELLAALGW